MKEFLKDYQFLIFAFVQIVWGGIVWFYSNNVASKEDVAKVQKGVEGVGGRVSTLEQLQRQSPDHDDISNLKIEMERTRGQMSTFTAELRGAQATMSAQTEGVGQLVARAENMLTILIENAINGRKT